MRLYDPENPIKYIEVEVSKEEQTESIVKKYKQKGKEIYEEMQKPDSKNWYYCNNA